jgi:hypothetical protein
MDKPMGYWWNNFINGTWRSKRYHDCYFIRNSGVINFNRSSEDIYNTDMEDKTIDPADISRHIDPTEYDRAGIRNEKDFKEDPYGDDLDIPGSELDDDDEIIGNEDEENNYYSLGGDNHNDLEEDQGD